MRRVLLALALFALAASGCGGGDDETSASAGGECEDVGAPAPGEPEALEAPADSLSAGKSYSLVLETNCGTFTVALDTKLAPETTASLVALARAGYFDDTVFHRIVPGFVIQGGDPTQTGGGGPGYSTVDVPPPSAKYVKGVVAMAKAPTEPPGASGSQFFVVTAADAGLPAEYAIVGEVTEGLDVVERIGALGDPTTEQPTQPVVIETVTVSEG
ncbi:MAG: peptidylprolyl isomerase [Actinobacteria bacterium]|nr:peptidylprolyl isomerase [Actinomycetota bacterium]